MNSTDVKKFYKELKYARDNNLYFDRTKHRNIYIRIERALRNAQRFAEDNIPQAPQIDRKQWLNNESERASRRGDIDKILELQKLSTD